MITEFQNSPQKILLLQNLISIFLIFISSLSFHNSTHVSLPPPSKKVNTKTPSEFCLHSIVSWFIYMAKRKAKKKRKEDKDFGIKYQKPSSIWKIVTCIPFTRLKCKISPLNELKAARREKREMKLSLSVGDHRKKYFISVRERIWKLSVKSDDGILKRLSAWQRPVGIKLILMWRLFAEFNS